MLGAIAGDIIGSLYEFDKVKPDYDFPLFTEKSFFTDDTVLTIAHADSILSGTNYKTKLLEYYKLYPNYSYGCRFIEWAEGNNFKPFNSYGNGSAMRVSPAGWAYNDLETVLKKAKESAEVTHNHPDGIKGAQAAASAIFLGRTGSAKEEIKSFIEQRFGYNLNLGLEELRRSYQFNETCQDTVPQAIFTFLVSDNFEDSIRKAIYIGGDSDTLACINGSIAEAFYGSVPEDIELETRRRLDNNLIKILDQFTQKYRI